MNTEDSHYVVTAHPPGAVLQTTKCNFLSPDSVDVLIAKPSRLEVRRLQSVDSFPLILQLPINGRITALEALKFGSLPTSAVFILLERLQFAVISYNNDKPKGEKISPYPVQTHASGSLTGGEGDNSRPNENGTLVTVNSRCIALHAFEGLLTILPVDPNYTPSSNANPCKKEALGTPFHCRLEEHTVLDIAFLPSSEHLLLALLYQDSRGAQHVTTNVVNLQKQQLHLYGSQSVSDVPWLKKSSLDGGSSILMPVHDSSGPPGVIVLGQRQFTYCSPSSTKIIPVPQALFLAFAKVPAESGSPRFLIGDEFGNLHMLHVVVVNNRVVSLQIEALGSCTMASSIVYLDNGLVFVASSLGDSQLVQIHSEPIAVEEDALADTTYLSILEEYTNLGPIPDFDLVPTAPGQQSQVVMASGFSKSGCIRIVRNGIGMNEYGTVEIPGIQAMWSLRKSFGEREHSYVVQSFVSETRVLGVATDDAMADEDVGGSLEEVVLPGLESSSRTLYVGHVEANDRLLQITETEARLFSWAGEILSTWTGAITVASANEAGQVALALKGGMVVCLEIVSDRVEKLYERQMVREVSCIDVHPFSKSKEASSMDVDGSVSKSALVAVGLWDDYTVRLMSIAQGMEDLDVIDLSTIETEETEEPTSPSRGNRNNMMARSLCLVTLDFSSTGTHGGKQSSQGVDMLFVGLGDGTLNSFAVVNRNGVVSCQSKKEVCLGTQRINLVPLHTEQGGSCVLATGDRPTVIYLAGVGGTSGEQFNPKLCYSSVNVEVNDEEETYDIVRPPSEQSIAINVAAPFFSTSLFDATSLGTQHYSLCVADDASLRLGVIDDIQKLHVTTCRLGMNPRRIVYCPDGRLFAVGCIESGIQNFGLGVDESSMGNCLRFIDDTTYEDLQRVDLDPYEMVLSMVYVSLKIPSSASDTRSQDTTDANMKSFLLVGTAYVLADEDEPTRGRILVYSCQQDEVTGSTGNSSRSVRLIAELSTEGGVYSICQFFGGKILATVNTRTHICQLADDTGLLKLEYVGLGHFGHILSLFVRSRAERHAEKVTPEAAQGGALAMEVAENETAADIADKKGGEMLAVVGDLMRSISLVQYYPENQSLEEVARDFNTNWTTAVEMLTDNVYLGAENWSNLFCLRRNAKSTSEEVRCRLDTIGEFHLGEMCNKFMRGTLVMPVSTSNGSGRRQVRRGTSPSKKKADASPGKPALAGSRVLRPFISIGTQTIFATVDGSLGVVLGMDKRTSNFFAALERALACNIEHVGNFSHQQYRACHGERRIHPAHGFVDGDLVEAFLDLDRESMEAIVTEMNRDGNWDRPAGNESFCQDSNEQVVADDQASEGEHLELTVEDVLAMVEEMTMLH